MAVKASVTITISKYRDCDSITRYFKLQASTAAAPAIPTTLTPSSSDWSTTEPTYTSGSTNTLYYTDKYVFSDGTFQYTDDGNGKAIKSSSYEAAKEAYNKAQAAQNTANATQENLNNLEIGGNNLLKKTREFDVSSGTAERDKEDIYVLLTEQPDDWETNYTDYYEIINGQYTHVTGNVSPTWQENTYYYFLEYRYNKYKNCIIRMHDGLEETSGSTNDIQYTDIRNSQDIDFKAGDIFTFSIWIRATKGENAGDSLYDQIRFYFYGDTGCAKVKCIESSSGSIGYSYGDGGLNIAANDHLPTNEWKRVWCVWEIDPNATDEAILIPKHILIRQYYGWKVEICGPQLEKGNKVTDWNPSPEDILSNLNTGLDELEERINNNDNEIGEVKNIANSKVDAEQAEEIANNAVSSITSSEAWMSISSLDGAIRALTNNEDGTYQILEQQDGEWTFQLGQLFTDVKTVINQLRGDSASGLSERINQLDKNTKYIRMTTYEGKPAIVIGMEDTYVLLTEQPNDWGTNYESYYILNGNNYEHITGDTAPTWEENTYYYYTESKFEVRITNTAMEFLENGNVIAYVNNNAFYNTVGIVREEIKIVNNNQGFSWKTRANGNLGLQWIDET